MATRAASRLEEQMTALLEKMDRQSEQLEDLAKQQSEHMDRLARQQEETEEHVSAVESDLNSVKAAVDMAVECRGMDRAIRGIPGEARATVRRSFATNSCKT